MRRLVLHGSIALTLLFVPLLAQADTLRFRNGDVLTGELESFGEETITLRTAYEGTVEASRDRIRSLETDRSLTVQFRDGTYFTGSISLTDDDTMAIENEQGAQQTLDLEGVRSIYVDDPREALRDQLEVKLSGSVNANANKQSGNTDKESFHLDGDVRARTPENRFTFGFKYNQEQTNDNLTEENALAFGKYDHFLGEKWFLFGSTTLEQDTFESLDLRSSVSTGLGYQFYETDDQFLLLEAGLSYINESYDNANPARDHFGSRYAIDYERALVGESSFFHYQESLIGTGETGDVNFRSRTGLRFPLADGLQSTLQMNLDWDEEPRGDNVSTNRQYLFTLGYSF